MRKYFVNHDNLRRHLMEFEEKGDDVSDDTLNMLLAELQHSCLIIAGDVSTFRQMAVFNRDDKRYGFLFTDMDEFHKFDRMVNARPRHVISRSLRQWRSQGMWTDSSSIR